MKSWQEKQRCARHPFQLAMLGFALSTALLTGTTGGQNATVTPGSPEDKRTELLSYEGQDVTAVELAGRPDLDTEQLMRLIPLQPGEPFSAAKADEALAGLKNTGLYGKVQLDLRPDQDGVSVMFILEPAVYFGMYHFPGAERFSYARLIQVSNYTAQEPYSTIDIEKAKESLKDHFGRNGFFNAQVSSKVTTDKTYGLANVDFNTTLGPIARFGEIIFEGVTPDQAAELRGVLTSLRARLHLAAIRPGRKYSFKTLQNATRRLESHLVDRDYLGARVRLIGADYNPTTNRADITFKVQPGPSVFVDVEGAHLSGSNRRRLLPIYQQTGLAPEVIEEGRQNLLNHFRDEGYFDVQVDVQSQENEAQQSIIYQINKGPRKSIEAVEFTGNQHFSDEELLPHVAVEHEHFLSRGRYDQKSTRLLTSFYELNGFNQVKVTTAFEPRKEDEVVVKFIIDEGPQDLVADLHTKGNTVPIKQMVPGGLKIEPGKPYSQAVVDEDRTRIMTYYLDHGFLTATFHVRSEPVQSEPHKFDVVYEITEGPQVRTSNIVTLGRNHTTQALIDREISIHPGQPLTEKDSFASESRLFTRGVFDWTEINPRRRITSQENEEVIVRVHEAKRNTILYGLGFETTNRGGNVPIGTVAVPGLPPVELPNSFRTNEETFTGPRANFQYTLSNVRGKAETITLGALYGPLERRAQFNFIDPEFRWTNWTASFNIVADYNKQNPIFTSQQALVGLQFQRALDAKKTQNLLLRYSLSQVKLTNLAIPELVSPQDQNTRLSTLSAVYIRDTRDNPVDAHHGMYQSAEIDVNPKFIGSSTNFGRLLGQTAYYREFKSRIVWANSVRVGLLVPTASSDIPLSQKFFTGGGSTLRGFPLNGAGPQTIIPACSNPADPLTCSLIQVPTGGTQLLIINSEFRIPVPLKKGLTFAMFYDGGNVFQPNPPVSSVSNLNYTNSVGIGFRYATPVGPVRIDIGHNLSPVPGIKATQIFISLGQPF